MPGADSAALRAAALPVMVSALAFHHALKEVPYEDVVASEELNRLRGFVDEALKLVEAINDIIPVADIRSEQVDPSEGLNIMKRVAIVKRLHVGTTRPSRQRVSW